MATLAELEDALKNAHKAGDSDSATKLADAIVAKRASVSPYKEGRDAPGALQGLISSVQGPTFGFGDEILGALGGVGKSLVNGRPYAENYREMRDFYRGAADQQKEQNPMTTAITRGMAALPTLGIGGGAAVPAGIVKQTAQATGLGALFGGVQGAGESTSEDALGVAQDAGMGAAFGGAVSGAAAPIVRAVGGGVKAVAGKVSESAAAKYAKEKIAEAFARDARGVPESGAIPQALARFGKLGPEARVADAGGQNSRALLDLMATLPGKTKQAAETMIHDRQAGRAGRMIGAAERELNPSGLRLQETVDDLIARRSEASKPLYEKLYQQFVPLTDDLAGIVERADKLGAVREARKMAMARGEPFTLGGKEVASTAAIRDLDQVKQGLDKMIADEVDAFGRAKPFGAALTKLKAELTGAVDKVTGGETGAYATARQAFAGPSAIIDAAREGRKFLAMDDQSILKATRAMTEGEKESFRLGAFEALRARLGTESGQTQVLKMWKDTGTRERLQALFGNERAFRNFAASVAAEARLKGLETVGRGSQTAARQQAASDLDVSALGTALGAAANAKVGNIGGLLSGVTNIANRVQTPEPVRNAIGASLLSGGPKGRADIEAMRKIMQDVSDARMRETLGLGLFGAQSRNIFGGLLGQ